MESEGGREGARVGGVFGDLEGFADAFAFAWAWAFAFVADAWRDMCLSECDRRFAGSVLFVVDVRAGL